MATKQMHYFAEDGNYGDADGIAVVETQDWTAEDWDAVETAIDSERPAVARRITAHNMMLELINESLTRREDFDEHEYGTLVGMEELLTRMKTPAE